MMSDPPKRELLPNEPVNWNGKSFDSFLVDYAQLAIDRCAFLVGIECCPVDHDLAVDDQRHPVLQDHRELGDMFLAPLDYLRQTYQELSTGLYFVDSKVLGFVERISRDSDGNVISVIGASVGQYDGVLLWAPITAPPHTTQVSLVLSLPLRNQIALFSELVRSVSDLVRDPRLSESVRSNAICFLSDLITGLRLAIGNAGQQQAEATRGNPNNSQDTFSFHASHPSDRKQPRDETGN